MEATPHKQLRWWISFLLSQGLGATPPCGGTPSVCPSDSLPSFLPLGPPVPVMVEQGFGVNSQRLGLQPEVGVAGGVRLLFIPRPLTLARIPAWSPRPLWHYP